MANRYHLHGAPRYVYAVYGRRPNWAYRGVQPNYSELIGPDVGPGYGYRPDIVYGESGPVGPADEDDYTDFRAYGRPSRLVRGPYRGVGPKGYQRSDQRILEDINDRLTEEPYLDASDIEVRIETGIVTLAGSVVDRRQGYRAEAAAKAVPGVKEVRNQLAVQRVS